MINGDRIFLYQQTNCLFDKWARKWAKPEKRPKLWLAHIHINLLNECHFFWVRPKDRTWIHVIRVTSLSKMRRRHHTPFAKEQIENPRIHGPFLTHHYKNIRKETKSHENNRNFDHRYSAMPAECLMIGYLYVSFWKYKFF